MVIALLLLSTVAAAQMQCDGRLVVNGATTAQVLDWCGEPAKRVRSERTLTTGLDDGVGSEVVRIPVEEWTYQPAGEFTRKLVFESGRLVKVLNEGNPDLPPMF
jgi:hypothetical protein